MLVSMPARDTCEIVTVVLPVFLRVTGRVSVPPTVLFPKARLVGNAEIVPVALTPVPLIRSISSAAPELLFSVIVPLSVPIPVGANLSVKLFVLPAASVNGMVKPVVEKPAPLTVALEIVVLWLDGFINCTDLKMLVPTGTLPNWTLLGVASSGLAATPAALSEKVSELRVRGLGPAPIVTDPGIEPASVGANFIDITTFAPGAITTGGVMPLTVYMSPTSFTRATTIPVDPVFVIVT